MPLNASDGSVAVFARGLTNLKSSLAKGEAHAAKRGIDPRALLRAKLADDMYDLSVQVHWSAESARLATARLVGGDATPAVAADAKCFAELYALIDRSVEHLRNIEPVDLEAGLQRTIEIRHRDESVKWPGDRFLLELAIPSFFFHVTTAYGILRHQGVDVTKGDFLGAIGR
ncbi:DUF1993 family protein [soil metagenome]